MNAPSRIDSAVVELREAYPDANVTAEIIEGHVLEGGVTIEVHGYFGVGPIEVKAKTAKGATELMLSELKRVRSERRQTHVWPPRFDA